MFKSIILVLAVLASSTFAQVTPDQHCDRQAGKKKDSCYLLLIQDRKEALEEFGESISDSSSIPANVKATVLKDYQSFMRNISSMCPNNACIAGAMQNQIKDMYEETNTYRDTGKR